MTDEAEYMRVEGKITREEAMCYLHNPEDEDCYNAKEIEAYNMAIKALEQEPCEDAISRETVIKYIKEKCNPYGKPSIDFEVGKKAIEYFKALSPVQPKQKTGHWIRFAGGSFIDDYRCNCCNHQPPIKKLGLTWGWDFTDYCPNCGAKMKRRQKRNEIHNNSIAR